MTAADLGLGYLVMGTGGDEMFYVNMGHAADCLGAFDVRGLWRFCRACQANWPGAPVRVARYVLWDGALKGQLRYRARTVLGSTFPGALDWVLRRRLRRARPPWLAPPDGGLVERLERRALGTPAVEMAPGEGAYVRAMRWLPFVCVLLLCGCRLPGHLHCGPPPCDPCGTECAPCPPPPCPPQRISINLHREKEKPQPEPEPKRIEQPRPQQVAQEVILVPRTVYMPFAAQTPTAPVRMIGVAPPAERIPGTADKRSNSVR